MKATNITSIAAIALAAAISMPAAANVKTGSIFQDVQTATGSSGQVSVSVQGGVATLTGWTVDTLAVNRALAAAEAYENVDKVINLISVN